MRARVTAHSIERAVELVGEGARLVFPADPQTFFQRGDVPEGVEKVSTPEKTEPTETVPC